jgi:hypothetical protein
MKKNRYRQTAPATSKRVLKDLLDDDPEYPMYAYIEELDAFFDGVADGPWDVLSEGGSWHLVSEEGQRVLGFFSGPLAAGTAAYVAMVNPRSIRRVIKDIVRLKKAYEDQGFQLARVVDERDDLMERLARNGQPMSGRRSDGRHGEI